MVTTEAILNMRKFLSDCKDFRISLTVTKDNVDAIETILNKLEVLEDLEQFVERTGGNVKMTIDAREVIGIINKFSTCEFCIHQNVNDETMQNDCDIENCYEPDVDKINKYFNGQ